MPGGNQRKRALSAFGFSPLLRRFAIFCLGQPESGLETRLFVRYMNARAPPPSQRDLHFPLIRDRTDGSHTSARSKMKLGKSYVYDSAQGARLSREKYPFGAGTWVSFFATFAENRR